MTIPSTPSYWYAKHADLNLIRITSYQYPAYDGDMAQLDEMADRVLAHADTTLTIPVSSMWHYRKTIDHTGINPHQLLRSNWGAATNQERTHD